MKPRNAFRRGEMAVAAVLLALALAAIWIGRNMPAGTPALPGPGFFPIVLALLLAAGASAIILGFGIGAAELGDQPVARPRRQTLIAIAALVATAFAFERLGAIAALAALLAVLMKTISGAPWWRAALFGAIGAGAAWGVFARLLGVSLPGPGY